MSDVISDASFVNKDSTKKLKSFQPLIGEALRYKEMYSYTKPLENGNI